ncbi:MAG: glycosyltransferase family 4 protein [Planctomycetota bacterium]
MHTTGLRIGIISTRLAGTDGVSLESAKWTTVLQELGHTVYYFAGESDRPPELTRVVPEAHFQHAAIERINQDLFDGTTRRAPETSDMVNELRHRLKIALRAFIRDYDLQLLKVENALSLPMNVPLGLALTEVIAETGTPTIAHHHDFAWERSRFRVNGAEDYLHAAVPPPMTNICHVVINSYAASELARRTGLRSTMIPNVMDFDNPPPEPNEHTYTLRDELGLTKDDVLLLQPTRVVPRKCIERSLELAQKLERPAAVVVTHESGDEGDGYLRYLEAHAKTLGVRLILAADRILHDRAPARDEGTYSLADAYYNADLVTYPSRVEGFGNAFLEAVYYRRPIMVSGYEIFKEDIEPKGFQVVQMGEFMTQQTIGQAELVIRNRSIASDMCEKNYLLGRIHYSHSVLRSRIEMLTEQYRQRIGLNAEWSGPMGTSGIYQARTKGR